MARRTGQSKADKLAKRRADEKAAAAAEASKRMLLLESLMARRMRTRVIVQEVKAAHDVSERTVYREMDKIRALWIRESADVDRESRRRELRYAMEDTLQRALDATAPIRDAMGKPVVNPETHEPIMVPEPNLGAAARLLDTLAKLDGLYQFPLELKVQESVEDMLNTVKGRMSAEAYEQLVRAITAAQVAGGVGGERAGSSQG